MANNIDQLNYYDPLIRGRDDKMSDVWISNMSAFIETLQGYLSLFGVFVPVLTTAQRGTILSPQEGQMIYNIDAIVGPPRTAELQIWQVKAGAGQWRTVTTV